MRTRSVCGFLDGLALLNQCAHFISGWTPYEAQKKTRESCPQQLPERERKMERKGDGLEKFIM